MNFCESGRKISKIGLQRVILSPAAKMSSQNLYGNSKKMKRREDTQRRKKGAGFGEKKSKNDETKKVLHTKKGSFGN